MLLGCGEAAEIPKFTNLNGLELGVYSCLIDTGFPFHELPFDSPEAAKLYGVWIYRKQEEAKAYSGDKERTRNRGKMIE